MSNAESRILFAKLFRMAIQSQVNVLITGESGTGKTRLAQKIHQYSRVHQGPFVTINLATVHEGTLETELFGHEKGAFTGAFQSRQGRLELAHQGTVFLDEVGELSLRLQTRLLEFLQSKTILRVGGNQVRQLDVRVISATHKEMNVATKTGQFREDLFYRLNVLEFHLPPLRERPLELDYWVGTFLEEISLSYQKNVLAVTEDVLRCFREYSWPGNLRELHNVLEFAVLAAEQPVVGLKDLPNRFLDAVEGVGESQEFADPSSLGNLQLSLSLNYHEMMSRFEKQYLRFILDRFRGRVNLTARQVGLNKTTLIRRMRTYGLYEEIRMSESPEVGPE